ncbi:MAG TPA: MATE family efflux transporter [Ruminococcaceae bacterium]|nr:MATE family efflux transporter [Oscillospiraceae bacterium]
MITDMTVGKPRSVLLKFSMPLLLSAVFQQLYNIADTVIAGRCLGEEALAAVGSSFPITMIFMAIALGSTNGASVLISHLFGEKKLSDMKTAVFTSFTAISALSLILTLLGTVFCTPMLKLLNTNADILSDSASYLRIYTFGLPFLFLYNVATCVFSSLGDSKTPLILLVCSSGGNVILDLLLVNLCNMGVGALALATLIAQGFASVIAAAILLARIKKVETPSKPKFFSLSILKRISRLAIPGIFQQSFVSVGNLFIQSLINSFDITAVTAAYAAAVKLNTFSVTMFTTLAGGVSSYTGQNLGAGKNERVRSGFKAGLLIAETVAVIISLISVIFPDQLIGLFAENPTPTIIETGRSFLRITSPFYFAVCAKLIADNVLRGSGTMVFFMISTFTDLILRVVLAYLLSGFMGVDGVWWSWPIGWGVSACLSLTFYFKGFWQRKGAV